MKNIDLLIYVLNINTIQNWGEYKVISFFIEAPWWKTWWFYTICFLLVLSFLFVIVKIKTRTAIAAKEKEMIGRLKILRMQMNPHFLYNALPYLNILIRKIELENAISYSNKIAKLLRVQQENTEKDLINLNEELEWLNQYLQIEQERTNNLFTFHINFNDEEL
ncbi:MAG: histidine kinase, partial [Chitinophagaceae bacterium]|nr:histidine kinase [Chitinophagaceae bacterium]